LGRAEGMRRGKRDQDEINLQITQLCVM
jgi:hypothetical protein